MTRWFETIRRLLPVALCVVALHAAARDEEEYKSADPAVALLTTPATFSSMWLSPDGTRIAAIGYSGGHTGLFLIDVQTLEPTLLVPPRILYGRRVLQPLRVMWIGNGLLVVGLSDGSSISIDPQGKEIAKFEGWARTRLSEQPGATEKVLVRVNGYRGHIDTVDPRTGQSAREDVGLDEEFIDVSLDRAGLPRFAITRKASFWDDDTRLSYWYRPDAKTAWQLLESRSLVEDRWGLLGFEDKDTLIISSRHGRDTWGVFHYDLKTRQPTDLMVGAETQDLSVDLDRQAKVRGVVARGLKPTQVWFDSVWAGLQAAVDAARPNHINVLSGNPKGRVLVYSYSDVDPGRWLVLDTVQRKLWQVGERTAAIDPARMRPMETLRYPAADGTSIPAFLTRPAPASAGTAPPPLVVLIHGGPTVRDYWGFDYEVQILAAHGYAVFQPQFRGSSGFGKKFEIAGRKQWGLSMQDDITAGVQHLIDQKAVDPQRICIMGASYGGYAALWGLVKTPSLYKCGISIAGVTDIGNMLSDDSDRNSDFDARLWQREMVGNLKDDKARFDGVSPLKHADRIQAPVLLIHGTEDARVPFLHGQRMRTALMDQGKRVEWLPLLRAGHSFYVEDTRRAYDAILPFLARHIGPEPAATTPPAAAASAAH